MKQTITICRAETRTIEVETPQVLSPKTIERLANTGHGVSGVGALEFTHVTASVVTDWQVVGQQAKGKGRKR